ncbi:hypothetical protein JG688_00011151, partial [Phytophthora aleatoria]
LKLTLLQCCGTFEANGCMQLFRIAAFKAQLPICVIQTKRRNYSKRMLYKPHTPMELGDAVLGQVTFALVFMFDHMIPAVHKILTWETDGIDLGPIIPEWSGNARPIASKSKMLTTQPSPEKA